MHYSSQPALLLSTLLMPSGHPSDQPATPRIPSTSTPTLEEVLMPLFNALCRLLTEFQQQPLSPAATLQLEQRLQLQLRELGRQALQNCLNALEPEPAPHHVRFESIWYTRLSTRTPQEVATGFGKIRLVRRGYRPTHKTGEATLFPLAVHLGLIHGATPALAQTAARLLGGTGSSQRQTLDQLRHDHGVDWGVKKLRQVTGAVAQAVDAVRQEVQTERLLSWLQQADESTGTHQPVLSVGRDGIQLPLRVRRGRLYQVASAATVTVFDRRGRRLGTVYLAWPPEPLQVTMSAMLTALLVEVLDRWQGPLPRLSYVTDGGDNETSYFNEPLASMAHPRTGQPLSWIRVFDYYHASQRLWTLGELLFGAGRCCTSWVRKMQKYLLKPGGVNRVLHAAAYWRVQGTLTEAQHKRYVVAYAYLRDRMAGMRYAEYRFLGVPLGSGVTEAACKSVVTQRLKLSGMSWHRGGAATVLRLRVLLLSGVWAEAFRRVLSEFKPLETTGGQTLFAGTRGQKAG
jgi:hypothetical protein